MRTEHGIWMVILFLLYACGGSGGSDEPRPEPDPDPPSAATLIFPGNNTECTEGEIVSATQSRVTFQWNLSQNTDSYQLVVRNLNTNSETGTTVTTNEATVPLLRGIPYRWQVISRANGVSQTAASAQWTFYNEGPGIENYAPFPAQAVNPVRGSHIPAATSVTLEWTGADVDDDITGYQVLFGTSPDPVDPAGTTAETTLDVAVVSGTTYYWKVITTDAQGNSSGSEIFDFRVQ